MMKKRFLGVLALIAITGTLLIAGPATAQWEPFQKSQKATPSSVATMYHLLIRKLPDFAAWARETDAYKQAAGFDKNVVLENEIGKLRDQFRLVTLAEPMSIEARVRLSTYSRARKGFIVDGIGKDSFFNYSFLGKNYAIVLPELANFQWLPVEGKQAERLEEAAIRNARTLLLVINLRPNYADTKPIEVEGKEYYLISGQIRSVDLLDPQQRELGVLWGKNNVAQDAAAKQELLNLYR